MLARWPGRVMSARLLAAVLVVAAGLIAVPGSASAAVTWTSVPPVSLGDENVLTGVTVLSPSSVWAAGWYTQADDVAGFIEHWNGASWKHVPSPNPSSDGAETDIFGIRAVSATDIWAVGTYLAGDGSYRTLILHWDGTSWKQIPSPDPAGIGSGDRNELLAVTASSSANAWAAGDYSPAGSAGRTLVLHWNGAGWKRVTSPSPGSGAVLNSVAASSASAWAVGTYESGRTSKTLVLHWNGTSWKHVSSPSPGTAGNSLAAVRSSSSSSTWAVGSYSSRASGGRDRPLALRWNGSRWKRVATPNPGGSGQQNRLSGLAVLSASDAWATGSHINGRATTTLILHWNGTAWKRVPSPEPSGGKLLGAGASSPGNIWTVGIGGSDGRQAIALHGR